MKLFVVESPTKAKTLQRYLGKGFKVKATLGHIKDLPPKELGVDEDNLKAKYVYLRGKRKLVEGIKRLAKNSEEVYIGTDPDREGEAIAYFLREEILKVNPNVKRVRFYEITKEAIKNSLREAGELDINLVHAQFSRRILDRLIGFKLSPRLWRAYRDFKLSAGRVQSPALRLIVEREREIQSFKEKSYYYVKAQVRKGEQTFLLTYDYRYEKPANAKDIADRIEEALFVVKSIKVNSQKVPPPKPFITSSLHAEANSRLGLSAEKTQRLAQALYERGLITYPRTDSFRMNERKAKEFMSHIKKRFGQEYVGKLRRFKEKPTAQGAHECIRPTGLKSVSLSGEEDALYRLILDRTLASLMSPAVVERTEVEVEVSTPRLRSPIIMKAKGLKIAFDGWCRVYPCGLEEAPLPPLEEGEVLKVEKVFLQESRTKPPPRYTEGSLIKALEKLGIGRPSTYASLVKSLKSKGYVELRRGALVPTERAFKVVDFLMESFPGLMDYRFTANMEERLDLVEKGSANWKSVVRDYMGLLFDGGPGRT